MTQMEMSPVDASPTNKSPEKADQETWKSAIPGTVVLARLDHRGELRNREVIQGGRTFMITSLERRLNQQGAANKAQDLFSNGTLIPVRLADTAEAREFASNPNILTESEMADLVKGDIKSLVSRIKKVSNISALEHLKTVARKQDVSVSKMDAIEARLTEVDTSPRNDSVLPVTSPGDAPSTPRSSGVTPK